MGLISRVSSRTYREISQKLIYLAKMSKTAGSLEVEETLNRIQNHKGVVGYIVINSEGISIKSTLDSSTTTQYVQLIKRLNDRAISVIRDLDPNDQLRFLRLRSQKHEIIVAPEKEYILVTIQDPQ